MIVFGTGSVRIGQHKIKEPIPCPKCQSEYTLKATTRGSYFHIFWIPFVKIGMESFIDCFNCGAHYKEEHFPRNIRAELNISITKAKHGSGIGLYFGSILVGLIALGTAIFFWYTDYVESKQWRERRMETVKVNRTRTTKMDWRPLITEDFNATEYLPSKSDDELAYNFSKCLTKKSSYITKENTAYKSRVSEKRVLILLEIRKFSRFKQTQKEAIFASASECLFDILGDTEYEGYLAIGQGEKIFYQESPSGIVRDSTANSSELLMKFYQLMLY